MSKTRQKAPLYMTQPPRIAYKIMRKLIESSVMVNDAHEDEGTFYT